MRVWLLLLLLPTLVFGNEFDVVVRDHKDRLVVEKRELEDLITNDRFEGVYFKIVAKTGTEAIAFDSPLAAKAANTYYHLNRAREFFASIGRVQNEQITIRIEIENAFHREYHYQNAQVNPVFNNATTIVGGSGVSDFGIDPWGYEIWFRPIKKIPISKELRKQAKKVIRSYLPRTPSISTDVLLISGIEAASSNNFAAALSMTAEDLFQDYLINTTVRFVIPEVFALFMRGDYFLDTALIPEVIYHEYTHYMMADAVAPVANTTLMEGFADYFATKVSNRLSLADELGDYGRLVESRDALSRDVYSLALDTNQGLGSDFVLSVLYEIESYVSLYEPRNEVVRQIFEMRKSMSVDSDLAKTLPELVWHYFPKYRYALTAILSNRGI